MRTTRRRTVAFAFGVTLLAGASAACGVASGASQTPGGTSGSVAAPSSPAASASEGATTVPQPSASPAPSASASPAGPFTLTSPAFAEGAAIPKAKTCDGQDRSPELRWAGAPSGTAALVLEMLDPDAHDWVHWLVYDIPGAPSGSIAANIGTGSGAPPQGRNSFGKVGWGGPCPPSGTHHYVFTLFALDAPLGLSGSPDRAAIDKAVAAQHVLGKATLTGTYRRG
jgi:Raf kinase inhibitor-like YbhB/YbcL family protein